MMMQAAAVIAAAGEGLRMKAATRKQYLVLDGVPVLARSLRLFLKHEKVGQVVVVIPPGDADSVREMLNLHCPGEDITLVKGGASRRESVGHGLDAVSGQASLVCIHDAARPFATRQLLDHLLAEATRHGAAVPVLSLSDTVKEVNEAGFVLATPARESLRRVQTPQVFLREVIIEAYRCAHERIPRATDDASLVEMAGRPVKTVSGEEENIKITSPRDLALASIILKGS